MEYKQKNQEYYDSIILDYQIYDVKSTNLIKVDLSNKLPYDPNFQYAMKLKAFEFNEAQMNWPSAQSYVITHDNIYLQIDKQKEQVIFNSSDTYFYQKSTYKTRDIIAAIKFKPLYISTTDWGAVTNQNVFCAIPETKITWDKLVMLESDQQFNLQFKVQTSVGSIPYSGTAAQSVEYYNDFFNLYGNRFYGYGSDVTLPRIQLIFDIYKIHK